MGVLFGRREVRQWAPEPPIPPFPGVNVFGQPGVANVPDSALQVPTVWACVSLLANSVSMLPLQTYRRTDGVPARITDPPLVLNPTADVTQSEWLHMLMVSLLLRGNAYGLITGRDGLGYPRQVLLLNPDRVDVKVDQNSGAVSYLVGPNRADRTADMWHVRGLTLPGGQVGLSPIAYAAQAIGVDLSSRKFAQDFYDGGGIPKAVLQSSMDITRDQALEIKERVQAATRNREPLALGSGVEYQAISVKPEESQFLETQKANVAQISRFFNVPAEMVGGPSGSSLTYSTVEQNSLNFLTYGVSFWLKRIEDAMFSLLPQPQFVQFNTAALLRTDADTAAKVDAIRVASKVMPPSRLLARMNEPPLTDEEKKELELVPLTVSPTGIPRSLKELPTAGTAPDVPDVNEPTGTVPPKLGVVNG